MGETERKSRKSKIREYFKTAITVLISWIVMGAVICVPLFGSTFSEYRDAKIKIETAKAEIAAAEAKQEALKAQHESLQTIDDEIETLKTDTFTAAAKLEKRIKRGKSNSKVCFITVDDGPYYRGNAFLNIFDKYDVKATFFLCTANGNRLPDKGGEKASSMYPKYLLYGHTIGNHTYSHNYSKGGIYKNADSFMAQIKKQERFIKKSTGGYNSKLVRFPGGSSTAGNNYKDIAAALREKGYGWADWTLDLGDSGYHRKNVKQMMNTVVKASKKQKIMVILCHEWSETTERALPQIIQYLKSKNYIFLPLYYDSTVVKK